MVLEIGIEKGRNLAVSEGRRGVIEKALTSTVLPCKVTSKTQDQIVGVLSLISGCITPCLS